MKPKKTVFQSMFQQALFSIPGLLATFIFSTILVGGGSYILIGARTDLNNFKSAVGDYQKFGDEMANGTSMSNIYQTGWLQPSNIETLGSIIDRLHPDQDSNQLDQTFAHDSVNWCEDAVAQLSEEKGQIDGYTFDDSLLKNLQGHTSSIYAAYLNVVNNLIDMIINWANETKDDRKKKLVAMTSDMANALQSSSSLVSNTRQVIGEIKSKQVEAQQQENREQATLDLITTKLNLSVAGVVLGVVSLAAAIYGAIQLNRTSRGPTRIQSTRPEKKRRKGH